MTERTVVVAVVLAGGSSRRFGTDKLDADVEGLTLLDQALIGLPGPDQIIVVGPKRRTRQPVRFVQEEPAGGGPTAALVTGLRAALAAGAADIVVLPGDAPYGGHTAAELLQTLRASPSARAVVATDAAGRDQPLQLALRGPAAAELIGAAGPVGGQGARARDLVNTLEPAALRLPVSARAHWDIDTPAQLRAWAARDSAPVRSVLAAVDRLLPRAGPTVVAVDGRSGSGKSTLAAALTLHRPATVVTGDDFYAAAVAALTEAGRRTLTDAEVVDRVFDWRRLRAEALQRLRSGQAARFAPYDWQADDGRLARTVTLPAADLVILEGVYSGRPELADLVDLAVCLTLPSEARLRRLADRSLGDRRELVEFWERGEDYYFGQIRPESSYDLVLAHVG